jgi:hypothetical protein
MDKKKSKKALIANLSKKVKPLSGNNRSFSNRATKRSFSSNKQQFTIDGKKYFIPVKMFKIFLSKLKG